MSVSYSNKFFLKPVEGSKRAKVYQRIIVNREKTELYTGIELDPKLWEEGLQRTKGNNVLNKRLSDKENEVHTIIDQLQRDKKHVTAKAVKRLIRGEDGTKGTLLKEYVQKFIQVREQNAENAQRTIWGYNNFSDHLDSFLVHHNYGEDVLLNQIDYNFLQNLDSFLLQQKAVGKGEGKLKRNSVNKHHSRFRAILSQAVREGLLVKNPYAGFQLKNAPTHRQYLTAQELSSLIKHDLGGNASLKKVRDIFIWSVYTGLRYQDAIDMQARQVQKDKEGNYSFQLYQNKTGESVNVPLLPPAVAIFKRYDTDERKITGKVLPRISNQKVNAYLKVIADLVGIDKPLTHHIARHTCATTVLLSNDVPIEIVSKWLGHNDVKTTQIYAKITNQSLLKAGKKIAEIIQENGVE
ncbi:integrase [Flammeovirgaceae bacterium 311]|nr:integrase [Flammeovirgaceae bacterium 311]